MITKIQSQIIFCKIYKTKERYRTLPRKDKLKQVLWIYSIKKLTKFQNHSLIALSDHPYNLGPVLQHNAIFQLAKV